MKATIVGRIRLIGISVVIICSPATLSAGQFGYFTYQVVGDSIEITDYPTHRGGHAEIPAEIDGKPVTCIGNSAFKDCVYLSGVTIPPSVVEIGDSAFQGCNGLTTVTIPVGAISIGPSAFRDCRYLASVTIPSSVTSIGGGAFRDCPDLAEAAISASVTSIGSMAFSGCLSLTAISVDAANTDYCSVDGVLYDKLKTLLVQCPSGLGGVYEIPSSVTSIGPWAFRDCHYLTGVTIPSGLTVIQNGAFESCLALTSVTIPPGVTSIGVGAFRACVSLANVRITDGVTGIGHYAFYGCTDLTSVAIPPSTSSIGIEAFSGCSGLTAAFFLGDAPSLLPGVFWNTGPGFSVYFLSGSSGFTSPGWEGYRAEMIDETAYPAASWLLAHGFDLDTDLDQDLNGDGVTLLMAYALNLDPHLNLARSMPVADLDPGTLSMSFHAASPGVIYRAETSTDLITWGTDGVSLSDLGPDGRRDASVALDVPQRFLRLDVAHAP